MRFTLRGKVLEIDRASVERAVRHAEPEVPHKHVVEIAGKVFPVKQVLREVLLSEGIVDLSVLDFTSADARSILRRLGFRLFEERSGSTSRSRRSR